MWTSRGLGAPPALLVRSSAVALSFLGFIAEGSAEPVRATTDTWMGREVATIEWTDGSGNRRTVSILGDNLRIVRHGYVVEGEEVLDEAVGDYGIGNLVHHGACGAVTSWDAVLEYSAEAVLAGPNHYVFRSTFLLPMCDFPELRWRVTNDYLFTTGEDSFIQAVAYDSSELDSGTDMFDDMRGPYNQMNWPKDGVITGFGWGTEYRFVTTGPIGDGDANVGGAVVVPWNWTEPNTIPYVMEWATPSEGGAVDREVGIVQNQPYVEQDFGGGYYGCGADCWATPPPLTGDAMPASWAVPTQLSAYDSNYRSGRITWGGVYGAFQNGHANDTGSIADMGDHFRPVNAWSFTHVVGRHTDQVVGSRVTDTENLYASTLEAVTGTVKTEGPRGPGNFVGPSVGSMPEVPYSNPGLDFVYRSWNVEADGGVASVVLDVSGSLRSPTFVVHEFPDGAPALELDGVALTQDGDVFVSYDVGTGRLFVTLAATLNEGEHVLTVSADGEVPVPSEPEPAGAEPGTSGDDDGAGGSDPRAAGGTGAGADGTIGTPEPGADAMPSPDDDASDPTGSPSPEPDDAMALEPESEPEGAGGRPPRPAGAPDDGGAQVGNADRTSNAGACACRTTSRGAPLGWLGVALGLGVLTWRRRVGGKVIVHALPLRLARDPLQRDDVQRRCAGSR
jgi:hypothetical protein